ncbi:sucrase ferredoxin [Streptomyces sp. NPDC060194]|uniref:sucrase ferredoxin n=1 Tax=Streptomyces sp. NPDC060194 TaxID=3347069 RepID=UPI00366504E6
MNRFLCADAARTRGDSLTGTAPYGTAWVLVEYNRAWPPNGFDGLDLHPATKARVYAAAQAVRARILLVRRYGRRRPDAPARWAVLRHDPTGAHHQRWGTWARDEDLTRIADALEVPPPAAEFGDTDRPPVLLVCTHGLHDTCCAVRGRPVARALADRWPDLVWECSHVGGDRFAANVVVVPDGVYYGNLDPDSAIPTLTTHLSDRIAPTHLRGYTDLFPPQQTAVAALLTHLGPAPRHAWTVTHSTRHPDHWIVRATYRTTYTVEIRAHRTPMRQLTCHGPSSTSAFVYEATSIEPG